MPRAESRYPADWLRIAEKDLGRVPRLLAAGDPEAAGFYLQQAVEKFLKAFLLQRGWELLRTHDLETLLNDALDYDPSLEVFRIPCQKVSGFYIAERYPFLPETALTEEEVLSALAEVKGLIEKLRASVTAM